MKHAMRNPSTQLLKACGLAVSLLLISTRPATAANPATVPSSETTAQHLTAKVTAVVGQVQYRNSADDGWKPCTVGLELSEGAEFRTGIRSSVSFVIPPHQTITLDRLGVIKLLEAVQQNGKYTTDMGMKYGRTRYDIEAPGVEHESTVRSPNGTLAVRDTDFAVDDERPFPPEAYRLSGTVEFSTAKRTISMGGAIPGNVKAVGDQNPADTSLSAAVVDPSNSHARTPAEASLVAGVLSRGATLTETNPKLIPIVSGQTPPSEPEIEKNLPGSLTFVLYWNTNANLDLRVEVQNTGEELYPATPLNTTPSGGSIPYNDIGGPAGGIEYAFWKNSFPRSKYTIIVNDLSGMMTTFTAEVFENGVRDMFVLPTDGTVPGSTVFTGTITAGEVRLGNVNVGFGDTLPTALKPRTRTAGTAVRGSTPIVASPTAGSVATVHAHR
jgi:hypothetical protein